MNYWVKYSYNIRTGNYISKEEDSKFFDCGARNLEAEINRFFSNKNNSWTTNFKVEQIVKL